GPSVSAHTSPQKIERETVQGRDHFADQRFSASARYGEDIVAILRLPVRHRESLITAATNVSRDGRALLARAGGGEDETARVTIVFVMSIPALDTAFTKLKRPRPTRHRYSSLKLCCWSRIVTQCLGDDSEEVGCTVVAEGDKKPCGPLRLDHYFLSDDFPPELFAAAGLGGGTVGIMMCAYFVPFHITHGPPFHGSVGKVSSCAVSEIMTIMCDPLTSHDCRA